MRGLGKLIVAKGLKKLPKVQKSPNLVTLSLVEGGVGLWDRLSLALVSEWRLLKIVKLLKIVSLFPYFCR